VYVNFLSVALPLFLNRSLKTLQQDSIIGKPASQIWQMQYGKCFTVVCSYGGALNCFPIDKGVSKAGISVAKVATLASHPFRTSSRQPLPEGHMEGAVSRVYERGLDSTDLFKD